ncbi:MAG: prepilin-type N-terminal cleavage/methylation domain-containing protein [Gammaproteobacteria bacterium]|nr:prepilin-type N-terminal cleavage/methylation domain-containing protein [Gammaproteobacteria bacterium]
MSIKRVARQRGVTLVELVIFIMIVSLGTAGILLVMNYTAQRSADPMVKQQALLIAESYLEEILLKSFVDPSTPATTVICPTKESGRASYDNVCDYHNLADTSGAIDQLGNTVTGLTAYNISVSVTGAVGDATALGPTASAVTNTGALRVLQVDVEVTHDDQPGFNLRLTGYRTNYNCGSTESTGTTNDCLDR